MLQAPLYHDFLFPTSNLERPLQGIALEVVLRVHLEATLNIWGAQEDIADEAG